MRRETVPSRGIQYGNNVSTPTPIKFGLVDPIRTSTSFFEELTARGIAFASIESGNVGALDKAPGEVLRATATIGEMADQVRRAGITHIVGCVDPSIVYADALCAQVGLPFNGLHKSEARRDKAKMARMVADAGLRVPLQLESDNLESIQAWARDTGFPVVVKPVESGGSDNVHLCADADAVAVAFAAICGHRNLMGAMNRSALVQEYVDGDEYVVDFVSYAGKHVPVDCFRYQKGPHNGRAFIYEKEFYLPATDPIARRAFDFASQALDALDFRIGASHTELKIDSRGDIVFIEVGPRLSGGDTHKLVRDLRADGRSQVEFTVDAFLSAPPPPVDFVSHAHAIRVYLIAEREGVLTALRNLDAIERLPSFRRISLHVEVGQNVKLTHDLSGDAGWIDLVNADLEALRRDEMELDRIKGDVLQYD